MKRKINLLAVVIIGLMSQTHNSHAISPNFITFSCEFPFTLMPQYPDSGVCIDIEDAWKAALDRCFFLCGNHAQSFANCKAAVNAVYLPELEACYPEK